MIEQPIEIMIIKSLFLNLITLIPTHLVAQCSNYSNFHQNRF